MTPRMDLSNELDIVNQVPSIKEEATHGQSPKVVTPLEVVKEEGATEGSPVSAQLSKDISPKESAPRASIRRAGANENMSRLEHTNTQTKQGKPSDIVSPRSNRRSQVSGRDLR